MLNIGPGLASKLLVMSQIMLEGLLIEIRLSLSTDKLWLFQQ